LTVTCNILWDELRALDCGPVPSHTPPPKAGKPNKRLAL